MFMKKYDVAVAGGGVAGIAAALAAARRGKKTILIEKTVLLGGLATNGLVLYYLPLCDGEGNQVSFGITEELLWLANKYGPASIENDWKEKKEGRFAVYFSPASLVLALDKLLIDAGVELWFDTVICGATVNQENDLKSIQVYNKSGFGQISADVFVDATGDSDIAFLAQNECLEATNSLVTWVIEHREQRNSSDFTFGESCSTLICGEDINKKYTDIGINGKIVSNFLIKGREKYRKVLDEDYQNNLETRKSRYPITLPTVVPLRHTRCIKGKNILQPNMEWQNVEDSIGLAADWRCNGKVWEIPYSTMLPNKVKNLIAAGRCTSSLDDAWEITRVIPVAAMTGEVAGVAASLSIDNGCQVDNLSYQVLSEELIKNCNFKLKCSDIKK